MRWMLTILPVLAARIFATHEISNLDKIIQKKPSNSERKILRNGTVFVGYASDPFGPSIVVDNKLDVRFNFVKNVNLAVDLSKQVRSLEKERKYFTQKQKFDRFHNKSRRKRGVFQLYNMVSCATGCDPLSYKGYGCYCGFLGAGYPVDGIDRCCKQHDWCYDQTNCPGFLQYFAPYYWICFNNEPVCAINQGEYGGPDSCVHQLCECDKELSMCLSKYACPSSRAFCHSSTLRFLQNAVMII